MDILIPFTKCWKFKDDGKYAEAPYFLNPNSISLEGIEYSKMHNNEGQLVKCTKLYYSGGRMVVLVGSPEEFLQKCRQANIAYGLLLELDRNGITIKEFIQQNERLNHIEFNT